MIKKSKYVKIQSIKNLLSIADECYVAESFFDRLRGLIGRKDFQPGQGLLLRPCNDIHMWFMSIPIDVVFVSRVPGKSDQVIVTSLQEALRPWKILPVRDGKGNDTIELPAGTIARCDIRVGDELCIS